MKIHNFSAGPCILPPEVFQKSAEAIQNFNNKGLSLIEISHRSQDFVEVMDKARALVKKLMNLGDEHDVLFLQGGATLQFAMVPFNLLTTNGVADYLDTGTWADKAIKEAQRLGNVKVVASSKDKNYNYIPKNYTVDSDSDYFHFTSNNTIFGTQMKEFPEVQTLKVCDMSSDIFSRVIDFKSFDLIYAGAQKNMGPAGATIVVVRKDILGKTGRDIPSYLNYQTHIDKDSMFNTPPVFSVYASLLTLEWIDNSGGVAEMEKRDNAKASLMYGEIDRNPLFEGTAAVEDRSTMNATFVLKDPEKYKDKFDAICAEHGISGIKGHRSVGGYRASMYNALPIESVQELVNCMQELEQEA